MQTDKSCLSRHKKCVRIKTGCRLTAKSKRSLFNIMNAEARILHRFIFWFTGGILTAGLAGCAGLKHQTLETEPHAVVRVIKSDESSFDYRHISRIDGLPLRFQSTFRLRPGKHDVEVSVVQSTVSSYSGLSAGTGINPAAANINVSPSGQTTVTGVNPFMGMQSATLNVESHQNYFITNQITLEAGVIYELDCYSAVPLFRSEK